MKLLTGLLLGVFLSATIGCTDDHGTRVIRAAVVPESPPNLFMEDGRITGLDLELFEAYCKSRGCRLRIDMYDDWQGMLGAVVSGQADVAFSGISITEKRRALMDFSQPYMDSAWHLVSLEGRDLAIKTIDDLKHYSIGYTRGAAYGNFIKSHLESQGIYPLDRVKLYASDNDVMADLRSGRLDLALLDAAQAAFHRRSLPLRDTWVFSGLDQYGFAFPRGSVLREDVDRYLAELGSDRLHALIDKWLAL
jgi:polar amino acid transport system substrate-binding protein